VGSGRWVLSLAALAAVTALSIDMSLPAQPVLARLFGVGSEVAQLTLSLFLVGYAFGQLLFGYLSDSFGRRRVLVSGLLVFTLAGAVCASCTTIAPLLGSRLVQGFGAAAGPVVARAMVRDTQPQASAARILSTIMAMLAVAPMLAPLAGAWLLAHHGWQAIFATHAVLGVGFTTMSGLTLPETLPVERRAPLIPGKIASTFVQFFRTPGTIVPTALVCLSFAGQFAFISDSPFVLIQGFGIPASRYGFYFGTTALALMAGSIIGGRLLRRWNPGRVLSVGGITLCVGGLAVGVGVHLPFGAMALVAPMIVYFVGLGLSGPSATAIAMDPVPRIAGTASAIIGFMQMLSGAVSGYVTTRLGGSDPRVLGAVEATVGMVAAALVLLRARGKA
jgi:DHA1 family bicyclomycin/chloramphenicol resistance-like MFS transporter